MLFFSARLIGFTYGGFIAAEIILGMSSLNRDRVFPFLDKWEISTASHI